METGEQWKQVNSGDGSTVEKGKDRKIVQAEEQWRQENNEGTRTVETGKQWKRETVEAGEV